MKAEVEEDTLHTQVDSEALELKETTNSSVVHKSHNDYEDDSIGHDLATTSSQCDKFDQESSELDELLQQQHLRSGCFGLIERLPLFVKLFLMLIISLTGLITFGAVGISQRSKILKSQKLDTSIAVLSTVTANLVNQLQRERDSGYNYFVTSTNSSRMRFEQSVQASNYVHGIFTTKVAESKSLAIKVSNTDYLDSFNEGFSSRIPGARLSIRMRANNTRTTFNSYTNCTSSLLGFLKSYTDSSENIRLINSVNLLLRMADSAAATRYFISEAIRTGVVGSGYKSIVGGSSNEELLEQLFLSGADPETKAMYLDRVLPFYAPQAYYVQLVVNNASIVLSTQLTFEQWWTISTARIEAIREVITATLQRVKASSSSRMRFVITQIVVLIVLVSLFIISSALLAFIFSKAITGPWKRIIEVQETTIKKFVPKGFLRLIKCYRLSDVTLGKSVERDLTIMIADIRNFSGMSEKMSRTQIFEFLNKHLANVGPVIRKHGGYIDKFKGDGILACFPNTQAGLKSALELQEVVSKFNIDNPHDPAVRVGVGVHTGRVMIGAIGEDERMEGTIVSSAVNLTSRLETLTKAFKAKVLTTSDTVKRLKNLSDFPIRPIGYVKVKGKKQHVKIYELIEKSDSRKIETAKDFKTAVDHMTNHNYEPALALFEQITKRCPDDLAAQRVKASCAMNHEIFKDQVKNLQIAEALQEPAMKQNFFEFCSEERSDENVKFWLAIEDYKSSVSETKRVVLAKQIYQDFLSPTAKNLVNTSDESKKEIRTAIQAYDEDLRYPEPTVFNNLQTEIEILMNDTFSRFKKSSELFLDAYRRLIPVPLVHVMDDDTL